MNTNTAIIKDAFKAFRKEMDTEIFKTLNLYSRNILSKAIRFRMASTDGHDFTGNLINSIVVALYQDGELLNAFTPGEDGMIRSPKFQKMSARKKPYIFANDYSGMQSKYKAEVPTNRGYAAGDIDQFLSTNVPAHKKGYCITVAYTVEYADWVETERQTTGYVQTLGFAGKQLRVSFIQI